MIAAAEIAQWIIWPVLFVINVILAGWFSGMETSIYTLNKVRLELKAESGNHQARIIRKLLRHPNRLLSVLLIGTNIHSYVVTFSLTAMFMLAGCGENSDFYTIAAATPVLFVFGESVPKNIFHKLAETLGYKLAWALRLADFIFNITGLSPLVRGISNVLLRLLGRKSAHVSHLGSEGLAAVLAEGHASGALTLAQTDMAGRVMMISQVYLDEVLQPLANVTSAQAEISRDEFLKKIETCKYSKLPLLDKNKQVTGVVDIYDVLADSKQLPPANHAAAPLLLPAATSVPKALYTMQRARRTFAVVEKKDKHIGIVTIKDLVEEIVGDLQEW